MSRRPNLAAPGATGTQMDQLHAWLLRRAADRAWLPSTEAIADALFFDDRGRVGELLRQGEREGLWTVVYDRTHLAEIASRDGSWRLRRGGPAALPPRRCLACRHPFTPAHRFNFLCCDVSEAA